MKNETMSAAAGSTLCAVAGLLAMLLVAAAGAGATERLRPMATGQPTAARRAADALLPPLNADIRDGVWIEGTGVLMTPSVTMADDGRLEVHGLICRSDRIPDRRFVEACRGGQAGGASRIMLVDPAGIDPGSLRLHQGGNGSAEVLFLCRGTAACVTLPATGKSFMRSSLVCNDAAACNRVVIDLSSLIDLSAPPPSAGPAGSGALQATLRRMISHIRRGVVIRHDTTSLVVLNPGVALRNGDTLEIQQVNCRSNLTSIDDLHLTSDCIGGGGEGVTVDKRAIAIDLTAIDPQSLRVAAVDAAGSAKGSWIAFGCRSGASCISGTDPSESHRDGTIVCNDGPDCRHLIDDLGTLIQLVVGRAKTTP